MTKPKGLPIDSERAAKRTACKAAPAAESGNSVSEVPRSAERPLKPFAERDAPAALKAVLDLAAFFRLVTEPLFVIAERHPRRRRGQPRPPTVYVDRPLPLREASELLFELVEIYDLGDGWRWRLGLCPKGEITRQAWRYPHVPDEAEYLAARRDRFGLRDERVQAPTTRAGAARDPEKDRRPPRDPASTRRPGRPKKSESAQDGTRRRATVGAEW